MDKWTKNGPCSMHSDTTKQLFPTDSLKKTKKRGQTHIILYIVLTHIILMIFDCIPTMKWNTSAYNKTKTQHNYCYPPILKKTITKGDKLKSVLTHIYYDFRLYINDEVKSICIQLFTSACARWCDDDAFFSAVIQCRC
jgi:hypothetical protein